MSTSDPVLDYLEVVIVRLMSCMPLPDVSIILSSAYEKSFISVPRLFLSFVAGRIVNSFSDSLEFVDISPLKVTSLTGLFIQSSPMLGSLEFDRRKRTFHQ